jgi:polyribonucleotide nucleotidyltransferase
LFLLNNNSFVFSETVFSKHQTSNPKPKMLTQKFSKTFDIGDGREITLETGRLARQADGSVTVRMGNSILLATVVATREPKEGQDFFPLSVDYMEKMASAGRIPGSFFKREGRLSESEILISRLIDRALRPLFPKIIYAKCR